MWCVFLEVRISFMNIIYMSFSEPCLVTFRAAKIVVSSALHQMQCLLLVCLLFCLSSLPLQVVEVHLETERILHFLINFLIANPAVSASFYKVR